MLTTLNYIWQFITVVIVGCMSPENWKACLPVHQWLPPYVEDLKRFHANPPYSLEKDGVRIREEYERLQRDLHEGTNRSQPLQSVLQK